MITTEQAKKLNGVLREVKSAINMSYKTAHNEFKQLLKENGDFAPSDYQVTYSGCDFPIECEVVNLTYDEKTDEIFASLHDCEYEYEDNDTEDFEVPITDLEPYTLYGEHILNLFGQAISYFSK